MLNNTNNVISCISRLANYSSNTPLGRNMSYLRLKDYMLICSNCGFGVSISEGIIDNAFNVMLLVQCYGRM